MLMIYTDGACSHNKRGANNIGGYSYVVVNESGIKINEFAERELNTTNNRMELLAVIKAIEDYQNKNEELMILSDSTYVMSAINNNWIGKWKKKNFQKGSKDIPNRDLWERMIALLKPRFKFKWIKGHCAENIWNAYADKLAYNKTQEEKTFKIINKK